MENSSARDGAGAEVVKKGRPKKVSKRALFAAIKGSWGMEHIITSRLGGIPIRTLNGLMALYPDAERAFRDEKEAWEREIAAKALEALFTHCIYVGKEKRELNPLAELSKKKSRRR